MTPLESMLNELIEPYLFQPMTMSNVEAMVESIADGTGYETLCKFNNKEFHFEIRCEPPILFCVEAANKDI